MKKFIICLFALFTFGTATAETMCVQLDASKSCTYKDPGYYKSDWTTTCSGIPVAGIAYCSNQSADNRYDKSDTLTLSSTVTENKYCWCKMTSPAVSSWVFIFDYRSAADCASDCADVCAGNAAYASDFRSALFSDLH